MQAQDNYVASSCSLVLALLFLLSALFKVAMLVNVDEVQAVLSGQQRHEYSTNPKVLVGIFLALAIFNIIFSAGLSFTQARLAALLTKKANALLNARRLRYRSNHSVVTAPPIPDYGYHLFLSHV